jgi:hypothetical protein
MNNIRERIRTEGIECAFCENKMEKIDEKQRVSSITDGFVCSVCGFVANCVASDVKN